MTLPPMDANMLAAFLDGTATEEERALVLREIAADRERYARFVEIVQLRADLDAEDAVQATLAGAPERRTAVPAERAPDTVVTRTTTRSPLAVRLLTPLILAAALIGVVLFMRKASVEATDMLQVAQLVEAPVRGNGAVAQALGNASVDPNWTVVRGETTSQPASARAYRAGVRMAQIEIAVTAQDSSAARLAADALHELLRDVPGAAPVSAALSASTTAGALPDAPARTTLSQQVRSLTGAAPWYDLGVWTESARHAAHRPQRAFFRPGAVPMQHLEALLAEQGGDVHWRESTEPLRVLLAPQPTPAAMDVVLRALDTVAISAGA